MQERRVGTFTLGICLFTFGVLFLLHIFIKNIDYMLIFHLWPVILIMLGLEILFYTIKGPEKHYHYDIAAMFIIILLSFFAMGMAGMDWIMENVPKDHIWWY